MFFQPLNSHAESAEATATTAATTTATTTTTTTTKPVVPYMREFWGFKLCGFFSQKERLRIGPRGTCLMSSDMVLWMPENRMRVKLYTFKLLDT